MHFLPLLRNTNLITHRIKHHTGLVMCIHSYTLPEYKNSDSKWTLVVNVKLHTNWSSQLFFIPGSVWLSHGVLKFDMFPMTQINELLHQLVAACLSSWLDLTGICIGRLAWLHRPQKKKTQIFPTLFDLRIYLSSKLRSNKSWTDCFAYFMHIACHDLEMIINCLLVSELNFLWDSCLHGWNMEHVSLN